MHAKLEPLDSHTTVVELGYLRPEFLDTSSLLATPDVIDKYTKPRAQFDARH